MYRYHNMRYNSPFIDLAVFAPDYIELLKHLKDYLQSDLTFISRIESKYREHVDKQFPEKQYPIGVLHIAEGNGEVEIHFTHYLTEADAKDKWCRRKQRVNFDNLLVKFSDRRFCTPNLIYEFENLNFESMVCFTARPYPEFKSVIYMPDYVKNEEIDSEWESLCKYYNFVNEANKLIHRKRIAK